jgi:tetratricopeptide (TPR) repeat protein
MQRSGINIVVCTTAFHNLGFACSLLKTMEGAIATFIQLIKLRPNASDNYYNRGVARRQMGDTQGAIADFTQAIQLKPDYAKAYFNRGVSHYELGDQQHAIADLQRASDLFKQQGKTTEYQNAMKLLRET